MSKIYTYNRPIGGGSGSSVITTDGGGSDYANYAETAGYTQKSGFAEKSGYSDLSEKANQLTDTHTLWGQPFNGTQDVDGDLTCVGTVKSEYVSTGEITSDIGTIDLFNFVESGGESLSVDYLNVLKKAQFNELVISQLKSIGGCVVLSPADGFTVQKIVGNKLMWKCSEDGVAISNKWQVGDMALCQKFNSSETKYYWAEVVSVGGYGDIATGVDYHFIELSTTYVDGTLNPEIGDEIVHLGNRTDAERGNAIILSSVNLNVDRSMKAPFICEYQGISDFGLARFKHSWLSLKENLIRGKFQLEAGDYVENRLGQLLLNDNTFTTQNTDLSTGLSSISQKSDEIELKVNNTALRLDNFKITLDASTEVNGQLTVNKQGTGFQLVDPSTGRNFTISSDAMPSYDSFAESTRTSNRWYSNSQTFTTDNTVDTPNTYKNFTYSNHTWLGPFKKNELVNVWNCYLGYTQTLGTD